MNSRTLLTVTVALLFLALPVYADHSININTADKATLETLAGIGPSKAQAIIDYRTQYGPFATIEDIQNVSGIGPATYANIKDHVTVKGGSSTSPSPAASPKSTPTPSPSGSSLPGEFSVNGGDDRAVVVGADAPFVARAYSGKEAVENAAFTWNFGDGSTGHGAFVTHRFEYASSYAVMVTGSKDGVSDTDKFTITAESAQLVVHILSDGSVKIENLAARDIDLSRWSITSSGQRFTFPENSLVLGRQTMRISPNTLHFYAGDSTELDYPNGALAFRASKDEEEEVVVAPVPSPAPQTAVQEQISKTAVAPPPKVEHKPESEVAEEIVPVAQTATSSQVAAAGAASGWTWWLAATGLSFAAAAAVFVARRAGRKEWNIIEDNSSSV